MLSVLAVEIDGMTLRAATLRRTLRGVEIGDCLKFERQADGEVITGAEAAMIASRIANCPKNVVIVSPLAAMVEIAMDTRRVRRLRSYQLKDAVRWEAEPYMTTPAMDNLVGYQAGFEGGDGQTEVWVSIISSDDYQALKKALAYAGLKLKRVYPPDVCFPAAALSGDSGRDKVAVEVGLKSSRVALIEGGAATSFRTLPAGLEAIRAHLGGLPSPELQPLFRKVFSAWAVADTRVLISGPGALDPDVVRFFRDQLSLNAAVLALDDGQVQIPDYAAAAGAGLRELRLPGNWRSIGLSDGVELSRQISESVHVFPVAVAALVMLFFLGHFCLMKYQANRAAAEVAVLTGKYNQLKQATGLYGNAKKESADLEQKAALLSSQLDLLQAGTEDRRQLLESFFAALQRYSAPDLSLTDIHALKTAGQWSVSGASASAMSIDGLALGLQTEAWCGYAKIVSIDQKDRTRAVYDFQLQVMLKGKGSDLGLKGDEKTEAKADKG